MSKLKLAADLILPIEAVTEKFAWLGRTGGGKSYGALKMAELMLEAGAQIGVIDPVGPWRALRVPATPDGVSYDVVVFGGLYGDLPLEPTAGAVIANLVCDRGLSFVLDVSQFIPSEQQRFIREFAGQFFQRKKQAPSAVHLFLEECQEYIAENPSGEEAKTLGVMQRLWKLGRNFGIGGSLVSQRPQEISKKALNMSGTLFAFQMTGPQERATIKKWVADQGVAVDIEKILQKLKQGEPHVESPTFLEVSKTVRILPRVTADLSSTPKFGVSAAAKRPLTPIDVANLKIDMAATIERAEANDPKLLRRENEQLKREIERLKREAAARPVAAVAKPERVEVPVLMNGQLERVEGVVAALTENLTELRVSLGKAALSAAHKPAPTSAPTRPRPAAAHPAPVPRPPVQASTGSVSDLTVGKSGLRRMLIVLAQRPGLTSRQIGLRAGLSSQSGTFATYLSKARSAGWLRDEGERRYLTDAGAAALGAYEPLPQGADLLNHWLRELGSSGASRMLQALADVYPDGLTNEQLGAAAGISPTSGTYATYISRLRGLELIEGRGLVRASEELFT